MISNAVVNNRQWYHFIYVRMQMITERVDKVLSMNYQRLEQPAILDMYQKAARATGGNDNGVEGLMHSVYALKNLNLTLKAGERLAVVGLNGAGKTTFIKLLCRLYDPAEGEILLDGINIKEYDYRQYMALFAPVDWYGWRNLRRNVCCTQAQYYR